MDQCVAFEVIVQVSGCAAYAEESEPDDEEVCRVHEVRGHHIAGLDALVQEEVCPLHSTFVNLLPCVGFSAGPDAEFLRILLGLGGKGVPERLALRADYGWGVSL